MQGKPLADAQAEVKYGASFLQWFAEEGRRIYGDIISPPTNDRRLLVVKEPVGMVVLITPVSVHPSVSPLTVLCTFHYMLCMMFIATCVLMVGM